MDRYRPEINPGGLGTQDSGLRTQDSGLGTRDSGLRLAATQTRSWALAECSTPGHWPRLSPESPVLSPLRKGYRPCVRFVHRRCLAGLATRGGTGEGAVEWFGRAGRPGGGSGRRPGEPRGGPARRVRADSRRAPGSPLDPEIEPPGEDEDGSADSVPMSTDNSAAWPKDASTSGQVARPNAGGRDRALAGGFAGRRGVDRPATGRGRAGGRGPARTTVELTEADGIGADPAGDRDLAARAGRARPGRRPRPDPRRLGQPGPRGASGGRGLRSDSRLDDPMLTRRIKRGGPASTGRARSGGSTFEILLASRDTSRRRRHDHIDERPASRPARTLRAVLIANFKRTGRAGSGRWKNTASSSTSGSRVGSRCFAMMSTPSKS